MQSELSKLMEGLHAVSPKSDCPHCIEENITDYTDFESKKNVNDPCSYAGCGVSGEVWICLKCTEVFCSRYVHGHMAKHNTEVGHPICFSFADFSYWCYECDSYVIHKLLDH